MDERIAAFIRVLEKNLEGLPQVEIQEAVGYYEEYLNDAVEAGKDLEAVISQLDSPEKTAGMIRAETSILHAQRSPGLKNYTKVARDATLGVTTPLAFIFISLFVFISYCMVVVLFAGAFVSLAGAIVIALGLVYEAFTIPSNFVMEIAGTIGLGLFGAGICILFAYGLYKSGRLFVRISAGLISRMLKKGGKPGPVINDNRSVKKARPGRVVVMCLLLAAAGLVLSGVSGLPVKYFTIFNSMKPDNITIRTAEFDTYKINKIQVVTANSHIRFTGNTSNKISVTYEQPDWLDYELGSSGSMFSFYEKSNGRLPLYNLASIHECRTELTISLPDGYLPGLVTLESTGGFIAADRLTDNMQVKTYTGNITLDFKNTANRYDIEASTENGVIEVDGVQAGQKTKEGVEYYSGATSGKAIVIGSSRGNIAIRR